MKYDPEIYHRKSIRLRGYDYSQAGAYFVTICTKSKEYLFGDVVEGGMRLNEVGKMVQMIWDELPKYYQGVAINAFQIMPNHVHGIIILKHQNFSVGAGPRACPKNAAGPRACSSTGQPQGVAPTISLSDVVHRFKSLTTTRYRQVVKNYGLPLFHGQFWQRNYYEHIIRNDVELNRIREYIQNNPFKWHLDRENPQRTGNDSFEVEIFGNRKNRLVNEMS